jgi:hypothetical protein
MPVRIAQSLKREFADRDIDDGSDYGSDYGKTLGLSWATTVIINTLLSVAGSIIQTVEDLQRRGPPRNPFDISLNVATLVSIPVSFLALGLMIAYWVKIYGYSKKMDQDDRLGDDRDDDRRGRLRDDDDDDIRGLSPRPGRPDERIR